MNTMGRLLFKLFLAFFGLLLMLGMLLFLLVYIVWATLRWLLTGQKPQVAVVWQRYRDMRRGGMWQGAARPRPSAADDVVDVEVREVRPDTDEIKRLR
jgi:hypothetical protein